MRYGAPLLALLCTGCAPAIYTFTALPNESCPSAPIALSWNASKEGQISSQPAGFTYATPSAQGSAPTTTPRVTTRYHLEVKNLWGSAARDADVTVPTGSVIPIGGSVADPSATCADGKLSVTAKAPPDMWQSQLVVLQISTLEADKHSYHVEHGGKQADLAPGNTSDALANTVVAGDWRLTLSLIGDEKCGTPTVPLNLGVRLTTACTPQK
jgi:hypothetical protein